MQAIATTVSSAAESDRQNSLPEALVRPRSGSDSLAELSHDARNMVTALSLYCDLLDEPGVLTSSYRHYAQELRLVAGASRRLVEKLMLLDAIDLGSDDATAGATSSSEPQHHGLDGETAGQGSDTIPRQPQDMIQDLREELLANLNLLAAIAGPSAVLTIDAEGGAQAVNLDPEDLTRVLVNLVKNASESMPHAGRIHVALREDRCRPDGVSQVILSIEDSGPGIAAEMLEKIFEAGYSTRSDSKARGPWTGRHQGLGLSITRAIVASAGGMIRAENRSQGGARFVIELPVRVG